MPDERPTRSCTTPAGESPVPVSAGAPGSRSQARGEIPVSRAGRQEPTRRQEPRSGEQARGPQHEVKPAASTEEQSESRAAHVTAKATSVTRASERATGLGGVWRAARVEGEVRNTGDPSVLPSSRQGGSYKPKAKSSAAERESEGRVVLAMVATNNAAGGKAPCGGHVQEAGNREGMAGRTGPNYPDARQRVVTAPQPRHELGSYAKRRATATVRSRRDVREAFRAMAVHAAHAASRRPSVSRVPEIGMHGLKGGSDFFYRPMAV